MLRAATWPWRWATTQCSTHPSAGETIRPTCDVASREDPGYARLEVLVDRNATVGDEPSLLRQRGFRPHADSDDDKISREDITTAQRDVALVDCRRNGAEMEGHAMLLVNVPNEISDFCAHDALQWTSLRGDDVDLDTPCAERGGDLKTDEARADHNRLS